MRFLVWVLCVAWIGNSVGALETADRESIQKIIDQLEVCWNEKAGVGFSDDYAEDADFINIFGMQFHGKDEIENRHRTILQGFLKGTKLETLHTNMREVQPGLVLATVFWGLQGFAELDAAVLGAPEVREGIFTHVLIKSKGKWQIVASQNTLRGQERFKARRV